MFPLSLVWIDILIGFGIGVTATILLFLVLGSGPRQRLNRAFAPYVATAAITGLGFSLAKLSLLIKLDVPSSAGEQAVGAFWIRSALAGIFFAGSFLLIFANVLARSSDRDRDAPSIPIQGRRVEAAAAVGIVAACAMTLALFGGNAISNFRLEHSRGLRLTLTTLGNALLLIPLALELMATSVFWRLKRDPVALALMISTGMWLLGSVFIVLGVFPSLVQTCLLGLSLFIAGFVMVRRQIFIPLRTLTERLNAMVAERTQDLRWAKDRLQRRIDLQTRVSHINHEVARIPDPAAKLTRLTQLIHNSLGYHHVYVYCPDRVGNNLVIHAAAGTTASTVMERTDRAPLKASALATRAAAERRAIRAVDSGDQAVHFGHTTLPGARAELSAPILSGSRLLGVIDLQSIYIDAFTEDDLLLIRTLADQVAVDIDNSSLLQAKEAALAEAEKAQRQFTQSQWQSFAKNVEKELAYNFVDGQGVAAKKRNEAWSWEIKQAVDTGETVISDGENGEAWVTLPIMLRGQAIGALRLCQKPGRSWRPEQLDAMQDVADRLALALETARLWGNVQNRVSREQLLRRITENVRAVPNIDAIASTAAEDLMKALGGSTGFVMLNTPMLDTNGDTYKPDLDSSDRSPGMEP
jgi:GAF domain-containing protein